MSLDDGIRSSVRPQHLSQSHQKQFGHHTSHVNEHSQQNNPNRSTISCLSHLAFVKRGGAAWKRKVKALPPEIQTKLGVFCHPPKVRDPTYDKLMDNFVSSTAKLKNVTKEMENLQSVNGAMMIFLQETIRSCEEKCHSFNHILKNVGDVFLSFYNDALSAIQLINSTTPRNPNKLCSNALVAVDSAAKLLDKATTSSAKINALSVEIQSKVSDITNYVQHTNNQAMKFLECPNEALREYLKRDERNKETIIRLKRQVSDLQVCLDAFVNREMDDGQIKTPSSSDSSASSRPEQLVKIIRHLEDKIELHHQTIEHLQTDISRVHEEKNSFKNQIEDLKRQAKEEKEVRLYARNETDFSHNDTLLAKNLLEQTEEDLSKTKILLARTLELKNRQTEEIAVKSEIIKNQAKKMDELLQLGKVFSFPLFPDLFRSTLKWLILVRKRY